MALLPSPIWACSASVLSVPSLVPHRPAFWPSAALSSASCQTLMRLEGKHYTSISPLTHRHMHAIYIGRD
ncbi:unnamed protein product [Protopolystoma xenopodis]|uniref:Uncharacterized protein n=1 Tax=Protopolystoma xenopodis TaxID=117903 RepID=A0A3S4ZHW8_9PLAT|nr:unnamed protein product [Protopolystoma xenopodis]